MSSSLNDTITRTFNSSAVFPLTAYFQLFFSSSKQVFLFSSYPVKSTLIVVGMSIFLSRTRSNACFEKMYFSCSIHSLIFSRTLGNFSVAFFFDHNALSVYVSRNFMVTRLPIIRQYVFPTIQFLK